mmetsp:Transcript_56116/g.162535  ORF Transcript_56116/g.162535 Transcript_56116/m.162535 type:complete len:220 (+) Transcript_56116:450-1109(+)
MSAIETLPVPWMSKKSQTSFMARSVTRTEGRMVAASQSVYWMLLSSSGSKAANAVSNSASLNSTPRSARAALTPSRVNQPALCVSNEAKAARKSSTSRLRASCATMVRMARSKRENRAKEQIRPTMERMLFGDVFGVDGALRWRPGDPSSKNGWRSATSASRRLVGSFSKSRRIKSCVTSSMLASFKGPTLTGSSCILHMMWSVLAADLAKGCLSVSTM